MRLITLITAMLIALLIVWSQFSFGVGKPEGLLLRGFESEASQNRRGMEAVRNGVLTTVRVDAAEQISATRSTEDIKPLISWYRARDQKYLAYSVFSYATSPYLENTEDSDLYIMDVDGSRSSDLNVNHPDVLAATVASAKAYVDAGVDGIEYDVDGWAASMGSFDATTLADFNTWLVDTKGYSQSKLDGIFETAFDQSTFDYRSYLVSKGVSKDDYYAGGTNQSAHFRLWRAFNNYQERVTTEALITSVNSYALEVLGREIEFYFNRYGFYHTPARRWNSIDLDSGSLGETWFDGLTWNYENGHTLEPVYRAGLKTFDKRYESWNQPTNPSDVVQAVYLASTIANNGVADWRDDYPDTAFVARFAYRFQAQLDHTPLAETAVFYPQATIEHNRPVQVGDDPLIGGQHYWYLGLGYLMADFNLNYDVLYAPDDLARSDDFSAPSSSDYAVVFAAETHQATDQQFEALESYVSSGGRLVVMGSNVLRYDELGNDQASVRGMGSKSYSEIFESVGSHAVGSGQVEIISLEAWASNSYSYRVDTPSIDIAEIRAGVDSALPTSMSKIEMTSADRLRAITYGDDSDGSVIVHLINHAFSGNGSALDPQIGVTLSVPLPPGVPEGFSASFVDSATGTVESLTMDTSVAGVVTLSLPTVTTWAIVRIGSELAAPEMPNIPPMAELVPLFAYETFSDESSRELYFQAADDSELASVTLWLQKLDQGSGAWGNWSSAATQNIGGTNRVDSDSSDRSITVDLGSLGEGKYRAQLLAKDAQGEESALLGEGGYETTVGYDTLPPDFSGISVEVVSGPADNSVIAAPQDVELSISGLKDALSGVFQINTKFGNASADSAPEIGETYTDGYLRTFSGPEVGSYGQHVISARAQDRAGNFSEWQQLYAYTYGLPPTIDSANTTVNTSAGETTIDAGALAVNEGDTVQFTVNVSSTLDDLSITWFKDGSVLAGFSERRLELGAVDVLDAATYYAVVENAAGTVQSESFVLTVNAILAISEFSRDPADGQVDAGSGFTLSVVAQGTGTIQYQWEAQILQADWAVITGATESTYVVVNASRAEHQGNYRVTVTDDNDSLLSDRTLRIEVNQSGSGTGGGSDADNDGVNDADDNCPNLMNAGQVDTDQDGAGDLCDDDIDGDGFSNTDEELAGTDSRDSNSRPSGAFNDSDGDGIENTADNCPNVANPEQSDLNGDGEGDVCDDDIDGDGAFNDEEAAAGTDPLDASSCFECFNWDVDGDGEAKALTDGLIVIRHLFGFSGDSLSAGAIGTAAARKNPSVLASYLEGARSQLDIDGDGKSEPLTDGLMLIRYLFGFSGESLISGAIGSGASRQTAQEVEDYIKALLPRS